MYSKCSRAFYEGLLRTRHLGVSVMMKVSRASMTIPGTRKQQVRMICQLPMPQYQRMSKITPTP